MRGEDRQGRHQRAVERDQACGGQPPAWPAPDLPAAAAALVVLPAAVRGRHSSALPASPRRGSAAALPIASSCPLLVPPACRADHRQHPGGQQGQGTAVPARRQVRPRGWGCGSWSGGTSPPVPPLSLSLSHTHTHTHIALDGWIAVLYAHTCHMHTCTHTHQPAVAARPGS